MTILKFLSRILLYFVCASVALVLLFRFVPVPVSAFMVESKIKAVAEGKKNYALNYTWVSIERISPNMCLAAVASEDQNFPHHLGFDFKAIFKAYQRNGHSRRIHGASTITQQTAKNLFLWPSRSYVRKGFEAYFTVLLELLWPKQRILEVYLNIAEMGNGVFGVHAASQKFFHKPPSSLSMSEAALLASVLPNPIRLRANRPTEYVEGRQEWIVDQMSGLGGTAYLGQIIPKRKRR